MVTNIYKLYDMLFITQLFMISDPIEIKPRLTLMESIIFGSKQIYS